MKGTTEQLQARLEICEKKQEQMKAINNYYREHGTIIGYPDLSAQEAEELNEDMCRRYPMHQQPYMPYVLKNNAAEIRRLKVQLGFISENRDEKRRCEAR